MGSKRTVSSLPVTLIVIAVNTWRYIPEDPRQQNGHCHMEPFRRPGQRYRLELLNRFGSLLIKVFAIGAWWGCTHASSSDNVALSLDDRVILERVLVHEQSPDLLPLLITPNTPPPPEVADGATVVTVKIKEFERVVTVEKNFNVSEVRVYDGLILLI